MITNTNWAGALILALVIFVAADYTAGERVPMEIGTVAYKTFTPVSTGGDVRQAQMIRHVVVVVQPARGTGYWVPVTREQYYELDVEDKLRISKIYGWVTGWEYSQTIHTDSSFSSTTLEHK